MSDTQNSDSSKGDAIDFEQALKELESLVERLENGDLSLEESLQTFERGIRLSRECQKALRRAEQKIQILSEKEEEIKVNTQDINNTIDSSC